MSLRFYVILGKQTKKERKKERKEKEAKLLLICRQNKT
jgi:hypothetical protein